MLVGEVEPRLARHHGVAQQLQGQRGLAQALRAAQQGQLARAQAARQVGVQRLEAGGPHPGGRRGAHRQLPVGFGQHRTEVAQQVGHPLIVAETGPPRIRCLGDSWARTDDLRRRNVRPSDHVRLIGGPRPSRGALPAPRVRASGDRGSGHHARPRRRAGRPGRPTADSSRRPCSGLTAIAVAASLAYPPSRLRGFRSPRRWPPPSIMVVSQPFDPSLLPYLLAPAFAAGCLHGSQSPRCRGRAPRPGSCWPLGPSRSADSRFGPYLADVATWVTAGARRRTRRGRRSAGPMRTPIPTGATSRPTGCWPSCTPCHASSPTGSMRRARPRCCCRTSASPARYRRAAVFVRGAEGGPARPAGARGRRSRPLGPG